jgi:hypothetical protein
MSLLTTGTHGSPDYKITGAKVRDVFTNEVYDIKAKQVHRAVKTRGAEEENCPRQSMHSHANLFPKAPPCRMPQSSTSPSHARHAQKCARATVRAQQ